jgi:hypothetical protein
MPFLPESEGLVSLGLPDLHVERIAGRSSVFAGLAYDAAK